MKTQRLRLRNFQNSQQDLQALYELLSDKEVNQFLPQFPLQSLQDAEKLYHEKILPKYLKKKGLYLAICLEKDNLPIGYLTVNDGSGYDFGYALKRSYWNQGIITAASQAVILYLKNRYHSQLSF